MRCSSPAYYLSTTNEYEIHFAGDLFDVFCNVQRWNDELATAQGQELWGKRTIKYFVYDSTTNQFAPSKFCAYINALPSNDSTCSINHRLMTMSLYTLLDESDPKFDGNLAQSHLCKQLGMIKVQTGGMANMATAFDVWLARHANHLRIHPAGPIYLIEPRWFD